MTDEVTTSPPEAVAHAILASEPAEPDLPPGGNAISWPGRLLLVLLFLWVIGVSFGAQTISWAGEAFGLSVTPMVDNLGQVTLIAVPLLLALWRWRRSRARAMLLAWLWPTLYLLALTPTRLLSPTEGQLILLAQLVISLLVLLLTWVLWRSKQPQPTRGRWGYPLALLAAAPTG